MNCEVPGAALVSSVSCVPGKRHTLTRIAIIQSCWHKDIVDRGRDAFLPRLEQLGLRHAIDRFDVPGAFEIPLHAKLLGASGRYAALIACGIVVDGGIYRHEFVAQAVISGLMQVQLDSGVPIFSLVLTPQHFHEHESHREFFLQHMNRKGVGSRRRLHAHAAEPGAGAGSCDGQRRGGLRMTVYVLAQLRFKERARYERYQQCFMTVLRNYEGAQLLIADEAPQQLEGRWEYDKLVLLSFADAATFRAWSTSPEYQAILVDRQAGADAVALLAHGVA